jgi:hypothetical protein
MKKTIVRIIPLALLFLLSGCNTILTHPYSASYEKIDDLKKQNIQKISIGEVQPTNSDAPVNQINLRSNIFTTPKGSFTTYLWFAFRDDLIEMGLYDQNAQKRIDLTLLQNDITIPISESGTGVIEVNVVITQSNATILEKKYFSQVQFESAFSGFIAISNAQAAYPRLVQSLLDKIYSDPEFINAMRK